MSELQLPMKGHCFCNRVQYTLSATPIVVNACHCRDCQRLTGSAFAINIMVEAAAVTVTSTTQPAMKMEDRLDKPASNKKEPSLSYSCPSCGVMLWATVGKFGPDLVFLRAGTLEDNDRIEPSAHFFVRSKHPWITLPEDAPQYQALPGPDDDFQWSAGGERRYNAVVRRG